MPSRTSELEALLSEMPPIEAKAEALQADRSRVPDTSAIQLLRDAYLSWYSRCLPLIPESVAPKFRDYFEGGAFVRRIKAYLEAPMERSSLSKPEPAEENPLIPYWANPFATTFRPSFFGQQQILNEAISVASAAVAPEAARRVEAMVRRFRLVLTELNRRRENRAGWSITDEYDLQDLCRALLVAWFDDVRPEEWTPSYAGGASRMDFLLKEEQVVVETKLASEKTSGREIRDQLAQDILRYQAHPDCQILVCFVYDPEMRIPNPRGFEQDLSAPQGNLGVLVAVVQ